LTTTGQKINGSHVVTGIVTKQGHSDQVVEVQFALQGAYNVKTYGSVTYNPQTEVGQLIAQTDPLDKFFIVDGNAVNAIPAGKRITFLQYSQLFNSSILLSFGYEAQAGYTLQQARAATLNPSTGVFGTDLRKYYVVISGNAISGTHFALDPTIDNKDYVTTSTNSIYNSGNNSTKVYINEFFAGVIYAELFIGLDNASITSATIPVTSNSPKVFTYTNMLPTYLTVLTGEYDGITDTTKIHTVERIGYSISVTSISSIGAASNTFINTVNNQFNFINFFNMSSFDKYYLGKNPGNLANPDDATLQQSNDNFGATIAVNNDASKIFIGSPTYHVRLSPDENTPPVPDVGVVWAFDRLIETFQVQFTPQEFVDFNVVVFWSIHSTTKIILNGVALSSNLYAFRYLGQITAITFNRSLNIKAGDIITVSSPNLVLAQVLTSYEDINGVIPSQKFGTSIACNSTGSEVLVGSPFDHSKEGQDGAIYRFTNEGKRYGYIVAEIAGSLVPITNPVTGYTTTSTKIYINGQAVYLDFSQGMDAQQIAQQINDTHIINVFAYATEDQRLVIRLINTD
jgi:hypothetical protein